MRISACEQPVKDPSLIRAKYDPLSTKKRQETVVNV